MSSKPWVARLVVIASVIVLAGVSLAVGLGGDEPSGPLRVHGDGLSNSHDGYRLVLVTTPDRRGEAVPVVFQILNRQGKPQTAYQRHRSWRMHLYALRDDMHAYQHVRPRWRGGIWRAAISVPDGGQYRIFVEFVPVREDGTSHPVLLGAPFTVAGDTTFVPLPPPAATAKVGGLTVSRPDGAAQPIRGKQTTLRFTVTGTSGRLRPHLGGYGHVTAYHSMTLAVTHLYPVGAAEGSATSRELAFQARFAERGEHRVFVEFRIGDKVHTAAFTVFVT